MPHGAYTLEKFTTVINNVMQKANVCVTASHFHPSIIIEGKPGAYPSGVAKFYGRENI